MFSVKSLAHSSFGQSAFDFALGLTSHFQGVFETMDQARSAAPPSRQFGYDNPAAAGLYQRQLQPRWGDHALLYWLSKLITPTSSLFDIGGNMGVSFYAFERYLNYPSTFQWVVYDVPASVELGRKFQRENPRNQLAFTINLDDLSGSDIVLASGALQYIDWSLPDLLAKLAPRPGHVLINKIPMYDGPEFVTLQDIGPAICAYRIFNRQKFCESFKHLGYAIEDEWQIGDLQCRIPFHPARTVHACTGLYFRLHQ